MSNIFPNFISNHNNDLTIQIIPSKLNGQKINVVGMLEHKPVDTLIKSNYRQGAHNNELKVGRANLPKNGGELIYLSYTKPITAWCKCCESV